MKQLTIRLLFVIGIIFHASASSAYLTELAVGATLTKSPLQSGNGNVPGTHMQFTDFSIVNLDFSPEIKKKLRDVKKSIIQGNTAEDDESNANAPCHFYSPLLPSTQIGLLGLCEENAKFRAIKYYNYAKKQYSNDQNGAWSKIGRSLHLLQDMAVPAHVNRSNHLQHSMIWKNGYEWWVARHWDYDSSIPGRKYDGFLLKPYLDHLIQNNPYFRRPIVAGDMGGYMDSMAIQAYFGYEYDYAPLTTSAYNEDPLVDIPVSHVVGDEESQHTAGVMVPSAIMIGGGLLQGFCKEVNCTGAPNPQPNNTNPGGNPDDNFDVSSRLIELEELDVTKQAWKDLYGRTAIKKNYNELFLGKIASAAFVKLAVTTTEAEFNTALQQIQPVMDRVKKETKHTFEETYYASADIAVLSDGFVDNTAELLLKKLKEPIREVKETFVPSALLPTQPVLFIPSGALTGFENSAIMKATLDEYVKQGGTIIVFAQAHGYDFATLPTPDGKPLTGYGWEEDINCFSDSLYIDTWHQMMSGQSRKTPTVNVDGYFTSWPDNSTILLRRTANGQPALLMYEHGKGRVIATTMYSDWAYGHGQASAEEIALVRDMLTWAKKPAQLPETATGSLANVNLTVTNSTATNAATVKLQVYNPDRSVLLAEQSLSQPIAAGQNANLAFAYQTNATGNLGIHHIDYILLDASGTIIQPQAETDSGRFVVSTPPTELTKTPDFNFAVNSDSEHYAKNSDATFTVTMYNHTATERTITAKYFFPHHYWESGGDSKYGGDWGHKDINLTRTLTVPAKGSASFIHTQNVWANFDRLWAYFYDENGVQVGDSSRGFYTFQPAVSVAVKTDKTTYAKGETVAVTCNLQNKQSAQTPVKLRIKASDPANGAVYINALDVTMAPSAASVQTMSFALPATAQGGFYTISADAFDSSDNKIGGDSVTIEVPLSLISVSPLLPATITNGTNSVPFKLTNGGKVAVTNGTLEVTFTDPDGVVTTSLSQPFALSAGQNTTLDIPLTIPPLKFGTYTLGYRQSDETSCTKVTRVRLDNLPSIQAVFDKQSYRVRENTSLALKLSGSSRFNLSNVVVTVSVPDAGYSVAETVDISQNQALVLSRSIPLLSSMTSGQHSVLITLTSSIGSTFNQSFTFYIAEPLLIVDYSGPDNVLDIPVMIENAGGVDSDYVTEKLLVEDNKGVVLYQGAASGTINAGEKKQLVLISLSGQAAVGTVLLQAQVRDTKTGKLSTLYKTVKINGLEVSLLARTTKNPYLISESVAAISSISTGPTAIENGNLKVTITGMQSMETGNFAAFLPKAGGPLLSRPHGVAVGGNGAIYVADTDSHRVLKFDANGDYLATWGGYGSADGKFVFPESLAVGNDGNIYVADTGNSRVQKFDNDGKFITKWGSYGSGNGQFNNTDAIAVGPDGFVYVTDRNNYRIQKFDQNGSYIAKWGGYGSGNSQFIWPWGVAVSADNYVYVVDRNAPQIQKFDSNGNFVAKWGGLGSGEGQFNLPHGVAVDKEGSVYVMDCENHRVQKFYRDGTFIKQMGRFGHDSGQFSCVTSMGIAPGEFLYVSDTNNTRIQKIALTQESATLFEASQAVNQSAHISADNSTNIGMLKAEGKLILQSELKNGMGQSVAVSEYPFYIFNGNATVTMGSDKRFYKPGEIITISGEVRNVASSDAAEMVFTLKGKSPGGAELILHNESFPLAAGAAHPFSVTTTPLAEGSVVLTGMVSQNVTILAQAVDRYEVAAPKVTATLTAPDIAGNDPFTMSLQLTNSGKIDATVTVGKTFSTTPETVTIPAGQTRLLLYPQQISADTTYTFTLTGDLTQTVSKTVKYGLAGNITITPQALYPEGKIAIPATIVNSGLLDGQFGVKFQLTQAATVLNQQAATYYVTKGGTAADSLSYNLTEGSYQLSATGQLPALSAITNFAVRKEIKADLTQTVGTQSGASMPVSATVTNLGYNAITGVVRLSLLDAQGSAVWSASQDVNLPQSLVPAPQALAFTINLSAVKPGDYTVKAELLNSDNKQLAVQAAPFTLLAPIFALTQIPPYQTFQPGANGTFTFKIKNSGNREGSCNLAFKAGDLYDSNRTEWLKPGEEKELSFTTTLPVDLDEKDYNAVYRLTGNGITVAEDVVRYRLSGINLNVTVTLDRQQYRPGESATFTLTVAQPAGTAPLEMFARVHYNTYDEKRSFTLSGTQSLTFTVPLAAITGEKLFYGIYHQSGRSIHLNSMYVNAANDQLAITSDKQVYSPGETVAVTVQGSVVGDLLLTGPGGFSTTIAFNGSAASSLTLPDNLTSGTYKLAATVTTAAGTQVTAERPVDVAGLKVTLREARLDKAVYAATDTMKLTVTAESNQNLPATLRVWVVDPTGTYTEAGESAVSLTAASPSLFTLNSSLLTGSMGIHKLVYGIYRGNDLIASGAKAFDIGDALVTAVSTDKREYTGITEPVTVKVEMFGTATGELALQLDGTSVQSASVSLSGFGAQTMALSAALLTPGRHAIKALLTSGGLASARETEFVFGSTLPDLTTRLTVQAPKGQEAVVTATVVNQGKSSAGASSLTLYDGDPSTGGTVIAVLSVPALNAVASATVSYTWNVLGKAGDHLVYAVADSDNVVTEFDERNNSARAAIAFPAVLLSVTTGSASYNANEEASLSVALANLSPSIVYADAAVELTLTDPAGVISILAVKPLPLQAAYATTFVTSWNSASHLPGGYLLKGRLLSGTSELASQELAFTVNPTVSMSGAITAAKAEVFPGATLDVSLTVTNNGNVDIGNGEVLLELIDKTSGTAAQSLTQALDSLAVLQKLTLAVSLNKVDVPAGEYLVRVTGLVAGARFSLGERSLKVLPPLEISYGLDRAPRVLVFIGKSGDKNDESDDHRDSDGKDGDEKKHSSRAETLIRQALAGGGYIHVVTDNNRDFKRALRSGLYNTSILAGTHPLTDHLDSELGERVNAGDGLILFGYDKLADVKMRLLTLQVAASVSEKDAHYPKIVVNTYGSGKVVSFASDSSAALLPDALASVAPVRGESVPGVPLTVTIALKSLGAPFDVRVTESVPSVLPLLSTRPAGTVDQHQISWPVTIAKDGMVTLAYTVGLPETGGSYEASTDVAFSRNGAYETYKKISHSVGSSRSVADIGNDILDSLKSVQAGGKNADELREAVQKFEKFLTMSGFSAQQLEKVIGQLLDVVQELQEMTVDTVTIRLDLDRLLKAYGRKWLESAQ